MKNLLRFCLLFISAILLFPFQARAVDSIYLGKAKADITAPVGTPLGGYGKLRGKPTKAVHDPIYARALRLSKNGQDFIFVSLDLVLVDEHLRKEVLKEIRKKKPLLDSQIIFFATHTHSGTGAIGDRFWERFIMGKFRKKVFDKTVSGIAAAVLDSFEQNIPVTAEYAETDISALVENRMDDRLNDPRRLRVLRFKNDRGQIAAHLIFMAAHPTLFPASDLQFSADFPGVITQLLEEKNESSLALFVNGASADLRPKLDGFDNRYERMKAYGFRIDREIADLKFSAIPMEGPWDGAFERVRLPRTQIRLGGWMRMPSFLGNRFFPRKSYFQTVRLGRLLFLAFPAEIVSETGKDIEKQAERKFFNPFVIGLANDYVSYIVPRRYYPDLHQYESSVSFYGPKMDWFIQGQADRLTDKLLTLDEKALLDKRGLLVWKDGIPILKLYGTAYHQGYEEGRILKNEIRSGTSDIFRYFRSEIPFPLVNRLIIRRISNSAWKKLEPYVSYEEYQQMRGIADGSGTSFRQVRSIHALPEIYPSTCAEGAYWGSATKDGRLIAVSNLDWNRKIGIHNHAAIKIHEIPGRQTYANIGYYGFTGVLAGVNHEGISVGQIGSSSADETMKGIPMPFVIKRILENASSVEDAEKIFEKGFLTHGYNYIIADAKEKKAIAVEATRSHFAVFKDEDPKELTVSYALPVKNAVFRGDPAIDPAIRDLQKSAKGNPKKSGLETPAGSSYEIRYLKQGKLVQEHYGKIDPEIAKTIAREIAPGSNIQSVIYGYPQIWVANAKDDKRAVDEPYVEFNLDELM